MIYFTSDLHLGHENAIKLCNRPFGSVEEMDETLIQNWNSRVTNNDTIYILGDMMFRIHKPPEEYLSRLKGKKHLLLGNHDKTWIKKCDLSKWFVSVNDLLHTSDGQHNISLCHYPMMSFPHMRRNGYMIFGHIHGNTDMEYWPLIERSEIMFNAGVDVNGFMPVTFEELRENNIKFKTEVAQRREV